MTPQIVAQDDKHKSRSCVFVFGSSEWGFVGFDWVRWWISEFAADMEYSHLDDVPFQVRRRMLQSPAPSHYSIVTNSPSPLPHNQQFSLQHCWSCGKRSPDLTQDPMHALDPSYPARPLSAPGLGQNMPQLPNADRPALRT